MIVQLGRVIEGSKSQDVLGINNRAKIIDYIQRAVEIAAYKGNFDPWLKNLDICADQGGCVTLPSFVGTVLQVNVGGIPTWFRNSWYQFHMNGLGSNLNGGPSGMGYGYGTGIGFVSDDLGWTPTFQALREWSYVAAICEDPIDGNGSLSLIVEGETMDQNCNPKEAITIPVSGPSQTGIKVPLIFNYPTTDLNITPLRKITRVVKPVTRGYVKLIGFADVSGSNGRTIGYYAPNETNPRYRKIQVSQACQWVRIRFRMAELPLVNDWDIVPLESYQATLDLIKAIRLRETNNYDIAEVAETKAVQLLSEIQCALDGPAIDPIQVDPSFGVGTLDYR